MTRPGRPMLFAPRTGQELGERVARHLGVELAPLEERDFEDGEHKSRPLISVRGRQVFVLHSLAGGREQSANDKLCRLLFLIGALRDAGADGVTAVVPYLAYSRKDRKTKSRDPVTTRYVASLFEAVGVDCVVTMDVHNLVAFQNAFRCRTEHLEARWELVRHWAERVGDREVAVMSPDAGGVKRAERFRQALSSALGKELPLVFMEKQRSEGIVSGQLVVGPVEGREVLIVDDLIASGGTLARAAAACRDRGAAAVRAGATHAVFTATAADVLRGSALDEVVITDSVIGDRELPDLGRGRLEVIDISRLLAKAIDRIHSGESIVELMEGGQ